MQNKTRIKVASILLYTIAAAAILFGLLYLLTPKILPYHEVYLGMSHNQLPPRVAALILSAMRLIGVLYIALGIAVGVLTARPLRKGKRWSWWLILVCLTIVLVPLLFITLNIGLHTPWWLAAILLVLLFVAMALTFPYRQTSNLNS